MKFLLLITLSLSSVFSAPNSNCPNGITPREAQKCTQNLQDFADKLDKIDDDEAMKPKTMRLMKDYCNTVNNCYNPQKLCDLYDPMVGKIMQSACDFYQFITRNENRQCEQKIENVTDENMIRCLNEIAEVIVDSEATASERCSAFRQNIQCSVTEVRGICSQQEANEFQTFFNNQARLWNC